MTKKPTILPVTEAAELLAFLLVQLPHKNRSNIKTMLKNRQILVNEKESTQYNRVLKPGQTVTVQWERPPEVIQYRGLTILYEDPHLLVINKQAGLLSIATEKEKIRTAYSILSDHIKRDDGRNRLFIIHRLDRDTSGVMMFAKNQEVQTLMQESWNATIKERAYIAVTEGPVPQPEGVIESYLRESKALIVYSSPHPEGGQLAITHYQELQRNEHHSLLELRLETGRKNQIRVHMQDIGHPIIGDEKYGATTDPIGRLGLHAWILAFTHPITHAPMRFETPIPGSFLRLF